MNKINVSLLVLGKNDDLSNFIKIEEFKDIFDMLQQRNTKYDKGNILKIVLYEPPKHIVDEETKHKIIREFHDSPHGGHQGVKERLIK